MNIRELARAMKEFERELVADLFGPPGPVEREQWRRAKRKRGRPRRGRGAKVISVSLEKGLLSRCDALAKKLGAGVWATGPPEATALPPVVAYPSPVSVG